MAFATKTLQVPEDWTDGERIAVATRLLEIIQDDLVHDAYRSRNRPGVASVLFVLGDSREALRAWAESTKLGEFFLQVEAEESVKDRTKEEAKRCTCPKVCDCGGPERGCYSNHCPIHTEDPIPYPDCPVHGEAV